MIDRPHLDAAVASAKRYLLEQAREGFSETRHVMSFPRRAGFRVRSDLQSSDVFARSVLASVLLDAAEADGDSSFQRAIEEVARREAAYVAAAKLKDRLGGWSYFPDLPELPPDLDSLSAAVMLFARAAPERLPLCDEPIRLALGRALPTGALSTWLVSAADDPERKRTMRRGIDLFWGSAIDPEVCAHFYYALWRRHRDGDREIACRGGEYVRTQQRDDGGWEATWYHGQAYGVGLCLRLLQAAGGHEESTRRAVELLLTRQRPDGGWAVWDTDPQETALALWAIGDAAPTLVAERGVACILDYQTRQGYWKGSPWIKMNVGRSSARSGPVLTYSSATLTTAFCLRTLLRIRGAIASPI